MHCCKIGLSCQCPADCIESSWQVAAPLLAREHSLLLKVPVSLPGSGPWPVLVRVSMFRTFSCILHFDEQLQHRTQMHPPSRALAHTCTYTYTCIRIHLQNFNSRDQLCPRLCLCVGLGFGLGICLCRCLCVAVTVWRQLALWTIVSKAFNPPPPPLILLAPFLSSHILWTWESRPGTLAAQRQRDRETEQVILTHTHQLTESLCLRVWNLSFFYPLPSPSSLLPLLWIR